MDWLLTLPFFLQTVVICIDEWGFHVKRGLPKWERIGHPLDTLSIVLCFAFVLFVPYSPDAIKAFIALAILSCLLVTKDEFVHKHHCPASEQWLHALLFLNHPILLTSMGLIWPAIHPSHSSYWLEGWITRPDLMKIFLYLQAATALLFCFYQAIYWNFIWKEKIEKI